MSWLKMLVDGENAGGAVCATEPKPDLRPTFWDMVFLVTYNHTKPSENGAINGYTKDGYHGALIMSGLKCNYDSFLDGGYWILGNIKGSSIKWNRYDGGQFYMAIVEKHY